MSTGSFFITSSKAACTGCSQRQKPAQNQLMWSQVTASRWCAPCAVGPSLLSGASWGHIVAISHTAAFQLLGQKLRVEAGGHQVLGKPPAGPPSHGFGDNPLPAGASCQLDPLTQSGDKLFHVSIFHLKCKLDLTE